MREGRESRGKKGRREGGDSRRKRGSEGGREGREGGREGGGRSNELSYKKVHSNCIRQPTPPKMTHRHTFEVNKHEQTVRVDHPSNSIRRGPENSLPSLATAIWLLSIGGHGQ